MPPIIRIEEGGQYRWRYGLEEYIIDISVYEEKKVPFSLWRRTMYTEGKLRWQGNWHDGVFEWGGEKEALDEMWRKIEEMCDATKESI